MLIQCRKQLSSLTKKVSSYAKNVTEIPKKVFTAITKCVIYNVTDPTTPLYRLI